MDGKQSEVVFGEHDLSKDEEGEVKRYEYSQNSVHSHNFVETYGIRLDYGRSLQLHFPIAGDETRGAILDSNEGPMYLISRTDFINYEDLYGL